MKYKLTIERCSLKDIMCNEPKNIKRGCYGFVGCVWILLVIIIYALFIIPYSHYNDYKLHKCNITRVEYPKKIPANNNFHNNPNWKSCNCGGSCKSWTPCVKMYSSVDEIQLIKNRYYIDRNDECTFSNDKCTDGFQQVHNALIESQNIYTKYINTKIECYYDDQMTDIYIVMDKMLDSLYFPLCMLITLTIIILGVTIANYHQKDIILVEEDDEVSGFSSFYDIREQIEGTSFNVEIPPKFNAEIPPKFNAKIATNFIEDPPVYSSSLDIAI